MKQCKKMYKVKNQTAVAMFLKHLLFVLFIVLFICWLFQSVFFLPKTSSGCLVLTLGATDLTAPMKTVFSLLTHDKNNLCRNISEIVDDIYMHVYWIAYRYL